jgi:hypothetical protein
VADRVFLETILEKLIYPHVRGQYEYEAVRVFRELVEAGLIDKQALRVV